MRAKCLFNDGKSLSEKYLNLEGYTSKSSFNVAIGGEYLVFAMSLWHGVILILLADESHLPNWFPLELFSIDDRRLPANWSFVSMLESSHLQALWGYEQLVGDPLRYDALLEREPAALREFYEEEERALKV
jgi:hypothetical protein